MESTVESERSGPYLSVVVATRNDDHGGRLVERTQAFIDGLAEQTKRFKLDTELIFVEWNPPPDRTRLGRALRWPGRDSNLRVRIIEVPLSIHRQFLHSDGLPIFQMIAKNVGIKRAKGRFVLATNPDLLYSDELIRQLAKKQLDENKYYRAERHDVPTAVLGEETPAGKLEYSQTHVLRAWKRFVNIDYVAGTVTPTHPDSKGLRGMHAFLWAAGFILISDFLHQKYGGGFREIQFRWKSRPRRPRMPSRMTGFGAAWKRLGGAVVGFPTPKTRGRMRRIMNDAMTLASSERPKLFTEGCGDFTLMSRRNWSKLRGYAEMPIFSLHVDSLMLFLAYYSGVGEACLHPPFYHIEHARGWATVVGSATPYEDLRRKGVPILTLNEFYRITDAMVDGNRLVLPNTENWGLGNQTLREIDPLAIAEPPVHRTGR